jgi:GT2 family glycosyltransferase
VSALRIFAWWWLEHLPRDVASAVARQPASLPLRMVLREAAGTLVGPWRLVRSRRRCRAVAPIVLPEPAPPEAPAIAVRAEWPSLAVVVPTRRGGERLRPVLDALSAQAYPAERLEVVVALDGTGPRPVADAHPHPFRLSAVDAFPGGVAAARNRGAEAAGADVLVFLDDDTVPEPDCLAAHAELHARPGERVVLGYCPPVVGDDWLEALLRAWWEDHYRSKSEPGHRWTYVDVTTGNSSLPRALLDALGGFDEAFVSRHEDWELGIRLLERGVELVYEPAAIARHHLTASLDVAVAGQKVEAAADVLLARKHPRVSGQLRLGAFTRGLPFVEATATADGLRAVRRLEALRLRTRWRRRVARLLVEAYVLGVREELRSESELGELLGAAPPVEIRVPLDGGTPPSLPPFGRLVFALEDEGEVLARVEPLQPGRQWNWADALDRIGREAHGPLLTALARRKLRERRPDRLPTEDRAPA